ncbi:MAG: hypothetical protein RL670_332 [Actinomycetota bacterium]
MRNNAFQERMSVRFRRLLSGDPNGIPAWLEVIGAGDDPGLFTPDDAPWIVHADFGTLVGGIRALLVQALHPGTLRGVAEHSRYQEDALGRLAGTIRWLTVTTFGSTTAIATEANRVNRLHDRVKGTYDTNAGESRLYKAADPDLLLWVHIAFMQSFLVCHEMYAWRPIPGGADNYIAQWSRSVEPLGLDRAPMTRNELDAEIQRYLKADILRVDERTRDVVRFIQYPPLPPLAKLSYRLLFNAAVVSLDPEFRALLGLRAAPRWLVQPLTRGLLRTIRWMIGPESPIEDAGRERLRRIGAWSG